MCPAALHDEQRMVLLARLRIVPDHEFPVYLAFRGSATIPVLVDHPQAGFQAAPYKDYPAQTFFLRGISLFAWHRRDGLAPVVLVSVCSVAVAVLVGCVYPPCADEVYFLPLAWSLWYVAIAAVPVAMVLMCAAVASHLTGFAEYLYGDAEIPVHGVTGQTALAVYLRKNLRILCGLGAGSHDAAVGQLHGRFRGRSFLPVRLLCVPHYLAVQTALYCHSALSQISAPSDVGRWMQLDILTAYPLHSRFVLGCLE